MSRPMSHPVRRRRGTSATRRARGRTDDDNGHRRDNGDVDTHPVTAVTTADGRGISNNSTSLHAALALAVWFAIGVVFYRVAGHSRGWSWADAIFYAADVGTCTGFGILVEDSDWSKGFSIVWVLVAAGLMQSVAVLLVAKAVDAVHVWRDNGSAGWHSEHRATLVRAYTTLAMAVWLGIGVAHGVYVDGWTVVDSLYFSVTAVATVGSRSFPREPGDLFFTAVFLLVGVPLFSLTVALYQNLNSLLRDPENERIRRLVASQRLEVSRGGARGAYEAAVDSDYGAFLERSLQALDIVDEDTMQELQAQFANFAAEARAGRDGGTNGHNTSGAATRSSVRCDDGSYGKGAASRANQRVRDEASPTGPGRGRWRAWMPAFDEWVLRRVHGIHDHHNARHKPAGFGAGAAVA